MTAVPAPWEGGLPWHDPAFSERMLAEHLSQEHDAASRRVAVVDLHVAWLHRYVLGGRPSRVLDLGCGPGLYSQRLAALGHSCTGIDFAPAAIDHARAEAARTGADCTYLLGDVRTTPFGEGFDLAMFLFGDLDTLAPHDAAAVVGRAGDALVPGGRLVLEVHTRPAVEAIGTAPPHRESLDSGLFSGGPHTVTETGHWDPSSGIALRSFVVVAEGGAHHEHVVTTQHRGVGGYRPMLAAAGFGSPRRFAAFGGSADPSFEVLVADRMG